MVYIYKNQIPSINDVVMVKITDINKLNVVGNLIDFNNFTGYISYSELCKKKRYNLHKIVNIGKEVIMQITGLNQEKNYVELSIRALINKDIEEFTNFRKKYLVVYNLWRYVFMKLKPELEMKIEKIDENEINYFMENTLWKIEKIIEDTEQDDEINFEELYRNFINPKNNYELIKNITEYDIYKIKNILDSYSQIKIVPVKQTKYQEFTAYSHELNGLSDIKNAMNYKSFEKYNEFSDKYEINILYLASNKYSITIKQKVLMNDDINELYNYLIQEITKRCSYSNIVFTI